MASTVQTFGPFTEAQGEVEVYLGQNTYRRWTEVTVTIFDASNVPGLPATGTLTGQVQKLGADQRETFSTPLDIAANERAWNPELSTAEYFYFTMTGLNAGSTYQITVNSWDQ